MSANLITLLRKQLPSIYGESLPTDIHYRNADGNLVAVASAAPLPLDELCRRAAAAAFPYRMVHDEALARFVGRSVPFPAEDSARSPAPPGGRTFFS